MSHTPPLCEECRQNLCNIVGQTKCATCLDKIYAADKARDESKLVKKTASEPSNCPRCQRKLYGTWCEHCVSHTAQPITNFDFKPAHPEPYQSQLMNEPWDVFAAATGGGGSFLAELGAPPGSSAYLKGTACPYDPNELNDFLGLVPERSACETTALLMAAESYVRARACAWRNHDPGRNAIGIGITASIASKTIHKGDHRVHIAFISNVTGAHVKTVVLEKGVGPTARAFDETVILKHAREMTEHAIAWSSDPALPRVDEKVADLLLQTPLYHGNQRGTLGPGLFAFLPGTFNPIHDGHRDMGDDTAMRLPRHDVVYTINLDQPHKDPLTATEMLDRIAMFRADIGKNKRPISSITDRKVQKTLMFTKGLPFFVDKMKAFPQCHWIMGADTLDRLLDPKWGVTTPDVYKTICDTSSILQIYPCEMDGIVKNARDILNRWGLLPQTNGLMPTYFIDVPLVPTKIRSTQIRDAAKAAR